MGVKHSDILEESWFLVFFGFASSKWHLLCERLRNLKGSKMQRRMKWYLWSFFILSPSKLYLYLPSCKNQYNANSLSDSFYIPVCFVEIFWKVYFQVLFSIRLIKTVKHFNKHAWIRTHIYQKIPLIHSIICSFTYQLKLADTVILPR